MKFFESDTSVPGSVLISGFRSTPTANSLPSKARKQFTSDAEQEELASEDLGRRTKRSLFRSFFNSAEIDDPPPTYRTYPGSEDASHALHIMPSSGRRFRTEKHNRTDTKKRTPLFVYYISAVQIIVFIASLIENARWAGSLIATKPKFNTMIGPSAPILISMGARYVPCMRPVEFITQTNDPLLWPCPKGPPDQGNICTLVQLCGSEGKTPEGEPVKTVPRQWYRFVVPIFLHSGLIHLGLIMLSQFLIGCSAEQSIGTLRFSFIYIFSGVVGSLAGANYASELKHANGPSASLFGITSVFLLDIVNSWGSRKFSWTDTLAYIMGITANVGLALLPAENGYAHCAGALTGLFLGVSLMRSAAPLRRAKEDEEVVHVPLDEHSCELKDDATDAPKHSAIHRWLKNRKALWWILLFLRFISASLVLAAFILLAERFYRKRFIYHV
ncbi:cyclin-dependent protein kinase [Ascosphaera pollenicola]|nr:cyclin-dependent protein kinase [Ascosphaera pollenicola]